jgi:hypothetical protein
VGQTSFKHALSTAPPSIIGRLLLVVALVAVVGTAFVAGDALAICFLSSSSALRACSQIGESQSRIALADEVIE